MKLNKKAIVIFLILIEVVIGLSLLYFYNNNSKKPEVVETTNDVSTVEVSNDITSEDVKTSDEQASEVDTTVDVFKAYDLAQANLESDIPRKIFVEFTDRTTGMISQVTVTFNGDDYHYQINTEGTFIDGYYIAGTRTVFANSEDVTNQSTSGDVDTDSIILDEVKNTIEFQMKRVGEYMDANLMSDVTELGENYVFTCDEIDTNNTSNVSISMNGDYFYYKSTDMLVNCTFSDDLKIEIK